MVLVDTADGATMRYAYGWAFRRPMRRIFYNLTITIISVLVAFVIGTAEFLQVIAQEFNLTGPFWDALASLDLETLGYFIIGTFLVSWGVATAYYRYKHLDDVQFGPPPRGEPSS
jgi:high-affinity nickel-transport protein